MRKLGSARPAILLVISILPWIGAVHAAGGRNAAFEAQNRRLLNRIESIFALSGSRMGEIRKIFANSRIIGQGNPAITKHPVTEGQCREHLARMSADYDNPEFEQICEARYMAPLYDPQTQKPRDATACIDRFEFPNIPCAYPVVWVRAAEAAGICAALGKRLCDAHEWEGACAGRVLKPDYRFDLARGVNPGEAVKRMRGAHNKKHRADKQWSYGPAYQKGICGADSRKTPGCTGGSWTKCGSNTYPAGFFPDCTSPLSVSDINGNAAEHMNLPLGKAQMASRGSTALGHTEMKGSWFIFDSYYAHQDWCRWRAPYWHGSRVMNPKSHRNYHLGFRCCKSLPDK